VKGDSSEIEAGWGALPPVSCTNARSST
jgi:hypothetical protein